MSLVRNIENSPNRVKDQRWWLDVFKDDRAHHVMGCASKIWRDLEPLRQGMYRWGSLYANDPFSGSGFAPRHYRRNQVTARPSPLSLNAVKAVTDTYVSMITKDKPKVSFVTSGGDWELQQKAELLEKFVSGVFYETDVYRTATQVVCDSGKFGTGCLKTYAEKDSDGETHVQIERILPWEVLVQPDDGAYGDPVCIYQVKWIDRLALMDAFPDQALAIAEAGNLGFEDMTMDFASSELQSDFVIVVEAWHKATSKKSPGRHSICCGQLTLLDEKYTRKGFPFEFLYRQRPTQGMFGMSLPQEISGLQLAINKLLRDIQRAQNLCVGHYMIPNNGEINTGQISERMGGFIRYKGVMPEYVAPPPVAEQTFAHLDRLWARCFETVGISQQAAQSQKPAGLNSGKALLVYADVQSQRFQPSYEEYQHLFLRLSRQILAVVEEMGDDGFYVRAAGAKTMDTVKWGEVKGLDESEFVLKLFDTNVFADEPAARLQQVQDMMTANLIDPKQGRRLLDMPDLEEFSSYENASYNLVMQIMGQIINHGEYVGPEPFMDLQEGVRLMQLGYLKGRLDCVPEERLELLSRWISAARYELQKMAAPAPEGLPAPPGSPSALPPAPGGPLAPGTAPPAPVRSL